MEIQNSKQTILQSNLAPHPDISKYWADTSEDPYGGKVKYFNGSKWVYLNPDTEGIKSDVESLNRKVANNVTAINNTNTNVSAVSSRVSTAEANIVSLDKEVASFKGVTDKLSENIAKTNTNLATTNSNIDVINASITDINADLNSASANIVTLDEDLNNVAGRVATNESAISANKTSINTINANIDTINTNVTALDNTLTNAGLDLDVAEANIAKAKQDITSLNTSVTSINTTITTINTTLGNKADKSVVPTKVSQLTNDANFVNTTQLATKADASSVPTKVSQLTNDSNFVNATQLGTKADKSSLPTKVSQLTNDSNYATTTQVDAKATKATTLAGYGITDAVKTTELFTSIKNTDLFEGEVLNKTYIPEAEQMLAYGVSYEVGTTNPVLTRIGNMEFHRTLPIQSKMRGCTLKDDGVVSHYFKSDWSANEDGTPIIKDGTDGMVMIELPEYYKKVSIENNRVCIRISEFCLPGYEHVPLSYTSAYECTFDRTDSANLKMVSVANTATEFRGGSDLADRDTLENTELGKPATSFTRATGRTAARKRGNGNHWNMDDYFSENKVWILYIIEYANFNSQLPVNKQLTTDGFRQGGLGNGVTTVNSTHWNNFNGYRPLVNCGASDSLGNSSGEVPYTLPSSFNNSQVVQVCRYRGIENPFGHIWKNVDGVIFNSNSDSTANYVNLATDPEFYADAIGNEGWQRLTDSLPLASGYASNPIPGMFFPRNTGGSTSTGMCDHFWTANLTTIRTLFIGANASHGANAGVGCVYSADAVGVSGVGIGSRLVYRI